MSSPHVISCVGIKIWHRGLKWCMICLAFLKIIMFLSQSTENGQRKDSSNPNLMYTCIRGSTIVLGGPKDNFVGWGRGVGGRGPGPVFDKSTIIYKFEISKSVRTPPLDLLMISIYLSVYLHNNSTFHNNSKRYSTLNFVHRTTTLQDSRESVMYR